MFPNVAPKDAKMSSRGAEFTAKRAALRHRKQRIMS